MKHSKLLLVLFFVALISGVLISASAAIPTSASPPNNRDTAVSAERGEEIGRAYLQQNAAQLGLSGTDVSQLRVTDNYAARISGARYVYFQQEVNGIGIHNATLNVTILPNGEVLYVGNRGENGAQQRATGMAPILSAEDAVRAAAASLNLAFSGDLTTVENRGGTEAAVTFTADDLSQEAIPVKLVYQPVGDDLRLAWDLNIYQLDAQHWWSVRVDAATGEQLNQNDWVVSENWDEQRAQAQGSTGGTRSTTTVADPIITGTTVESEPFAPMNPDSYKVYPIPVESPNHTTPLPPADGRQVVTNPANSTASPFGWHDTNGAAGAEFTITRGNNAHAYTDVDDNNLPDAGSSPDGGAGLNFTPPLNLAQEPTTYKPAAVVNLFYWNNLMHDIPYVYGFDEVAGNFQQNNYGHGGAGNDYVFAEAQDGSGTNNANFATPPDGTNGRMQMYLWTTVSPMVDGDLDSGIIAHEYGHGISTRLTGGPANSECLNNNEQGGEGWSDWQALFLTQRPGDQATDGRGIGTYALGEPPNGPGIRPSPYSTDTSINNYSYSDISGLSVPHGVGFVWATMLWEVNWNLIAAHGYNPNVYAAWNTGGNNLTYQLIQDGMAMQPCSPGFVDARDAIIAADVALTSGANKCAIWAGFAKRGLGANASQGSSNSIFDGTEDFTLPAECSGTPTIGVSDASFTVTHSGPGRTTSEMLGIQNTGSGSLTWNITEDNALTDVPVASAPATKNGTGSAPSQPKAPTDRPASGPIVLDGGFETGDNNAYWIGENSDNGITPICDVNCGGNDDAHTGDWWVWFGGWENLPETGYVTQTITIPAGTAELSFWLQIQATAQDGYMSAKLDGTEVFRVEEDTTGYGAYQPVTVDISDYADGNPHQLRFESEVSGAGVTNFYLDDVAITAASGPTPTPGPSPTPTNTPVPGQCEEASNIPWLTVSPANGSAGPGVTNNVTLTFSSIGLTAGSTHTARLCLRSNAPSGALTVIPVTLNVGNAPPLDQLYLPLVQKLQ